MFYSSPGLAAGASTIYENEFTFSRFSCRISGGDVRIGVENLSKTSNLYLLQLSSTYSEFEVPSINGYSPYKVLIKNYGSNTAYIFINFKTFGAEKEPTPKIWL